MGGVWWWVAAAAGARIVVIGGGAAGYFAAIRAATAFQESDPADAAPSPSHSPQVLLLEQANAVLTKVSISGGGRCNVCHDESKDVRFLAASYPRGNFLQLGALNRFGASDAANWFRDHGVPLKTEQDGRMFPTSDTSKSIVDALTTASSEAGVTVLRRSKVVSIVQDNNGTDRFRISCQTMGENATTREYACRSVVVATGGNALTLELLSKLGIPIVPPVPSLFTLRVNSNSVINGLAGVSVQSVNLRLIVHGQGAANSQSRRRTNKHLDAAVFESSGPLLITHRGVSGPAVLRVSAFGARALAASSYVAECEINWCELTMDQAQRACENMRSRASKRTMANVPPLPLPKRLWMAIVKEALAPSSEREESSPSSEREQLSQTAQKWAQLSKKQARKLAKGLTACRLKVNGKDTNKEEFVTAGGVDLKGIDCKSYESVKIAGLFFAGEVLDVDGITGGFNFQNAWTSGWLAGSAAAADAQSCP